MEVDDSAEPNPVPPPDDVDVPRSDDSDPALWKVDKNFQEVIVTKPIEQNISSEDFSESEREHNGHKRFLSKSLFKRSMVNGEKVNREWLVYSKSTGSVYCAPCKVFCRRNEDKAFINGFSDWKNSHSRVRAHETSTEHKNCIRIWHARASNEQRIDQDLVRELEEESKYWQAVLRRVVEVIKFLLLLGT